MSRHFGLAPMKVLLRDSMSIRVKVLTLAVAPILTDVLQMPVPREPGVPISLCRLRLLITVVSPGFGSQLQAGSC